MATLVERLRDPAVAGTHWGALASEAADRIEEDAQRIENLTTLLRRAGCIDCVHDYGADFPHAFDTHRKALLDPENSKEAKP